MKSTIPLLFYITSVLAIHEQSQHIATLTDKNFEEVVLPSNQLWVVQFWKPDCDLCAQFESQWEELAAESGCGLKFGALNADSNDYIADYYQIQEYPTVLLFGLDKSAPTWFPTAYDLPGLPPVIAKELENMVFSRLKEPNNPVPKKVKPKVHTLTDESFESKVMQSTDMWMIEFMTSWCDVCKDMPRQWREALEIVEDDVKFGRLDTEKYPKIADRFGIDRYPTILIFPPEDKSKYEEYTDILDGDVMGRTALDKFESYTFVPNIPRLVSSSQLEDICDKKKMLCLVVRVKTEEEIEFLTPVIQEFADKRVSFLYTLADDHPDLISQFKVPESGVLALYYNKQQYYIMSESFDEKGVTAFVKGVTKRKYFFLQYAKFPKLRNLS